MRLVTFNDTFRSEYRSLSHTPPLFQKLNILNIFDIFKVQVGKLVYESLNCIGLMQKIIKFTRASEVHTHNTRYSSDGNHYNPYARTTRYGLRSLQIEGGKLWSTIPITIKNSNSKTAFIRLLIKKYIVTKYKYL